jgi:peptidoglycan/xylan/chitin deacetylase (PgdA/CDA1 family)
MAQIQTRIANSIDRNLKRMRCAFKYHQSPKPLSEVDPVCLTIFFDYEGKWARPGAEDTSRKAMRYILDTLRKYHVKATFNTVGKLLIEEAPIIETLINDGHEIASHTLEHTLVSGFSPQRMSEDIRIYRNLVNSFAFNVIGFRGPQTTWTQKTLLGLLKADILWNAENDRAPYPYIIKTHKSRRLWRMPISITDWPIEGLSIDPYEMLNRWIEMIEMSEKQHRFISIGFHPWLIGKTPERLHIFSILIEYISQRESLKIAPFGYFAHICEKAVANI